MASQFAWLDHPADYQCRTQEADAMCSQRKSRTKLGTGAMRAASSDVRFSATSVLPTFTRTPWLADRVADCRPERLLGSLIERGGPPADEAADR